VARRVVKEQKEKSRTSGLVESVGDPFWLTDK
jgi:hypothetical protein